MAYGTYYYFNEEGPLQRCAHTSVLRLSTHVPTLQEESETAYMRLLQRLQTTSTIRMTGAIFSTYCRPEQLLTSSALPWYKRAMAIKLDMHRLLDPAHHDLTLHAASSMPMDPRTDVPIAHATRRMRALADDLGLTPTDATAPTRHSPAPAPQTYATFAHSDCVTSQTSWHALQHMILRSGHVADDAQRLRTAQHMNPSAQRHCSHCSASIVPDEHLTSDPVARWHRVAHHLLHCTCAKRNRPRAIAWLYATLTEAVHAEPHHPLHAVFAPFLHPSHRGDATVDTRHMLTFLINPGAPEYCLHSNKRAATVAIARFLAHDFAAEKQGWTRAPSITTPPRTMGDYLWHKYPVDGHLAQYAVSTHNTTGSSSSANSSSASSTGSAQGDTASSATSRPAKRSRHDTEQNPGWGSGPTHPAGRKPARPMPG